MRPLLTGDLALVCAITCSSGVAGTRGNIAEDKKATDLAIGDVADDKKATDLAIAELHQRFNAREHEQIYDDAHSLMRTSRIKAEFCSDLKEVHDTLGEVDSVTDKWMNVVVGTSVEINAIYNTRFTKGDGTEMIRLIKDGGKVRLVDYRIARGTKKPNVPAWHFE